ncbi:hypothetical protein PVAND_008566 [Polypedilum vanderplanki]|uniref:BTB domain-containing protein n=1 Tax=Polypedilum vanderplanki TaxID=319348 RepID=A0A9J6CB23_POLVA|nr:hypothetical protein PVAND_008566 [Polypedilum vanderplanki]
MSSAVKKSFIKSYNPEIDSSEKSSFDNNISSDSTTFEFIEGNQIVFNAPTNKTKEEKQRLNEELVMESANFCGNDTDSWEKIEISEFDVEKEELEVCRNFLMNEKAFNSGSDRKVNLSTRPSTKPCFIDASSLLDDDEYDVATSSSFTKSNLLLAHGMKDESSSSNNRNIMDNFQIDSLKPSYDNIKDQYSTMPSSNIPKINPFRTTSSLDHQQMQILYGDNSIDNERQQQGHIIFHTTIPSNHNNRNNDYSSDLEYSSSSTCGTSGTFNNNLLFENTSGYSGSTNYSRLQSDVDSITLPDTPFNSIVQVAKKLEICAIDNSDDELFHRNTSSPVQIPKRIMKHDESAPILSGGASINDFVPKKCESPIVKRKTDSCPIVSGGSLDIVEEPQQVHHVKIPKSANSFSWIVDLKNDDIKVDNVEDEEDKRDDYFPKTSNCATPKNSLGFYVDFNSLEPVPEVSKPPPKNESLRKQSLKKSTGFYVDFSSSDISCPNTPIKQIKEDGKSDEERRVSIESNDSRKNLFNMFVELDKNEIEKCETVNETACVVKQEKEPSPPQSAESIGKKGCFMFIENDAHVVKHRNRKILPKDSSSSTKRHSWNVNQTNEFDDIKNSAKVYQRSTSVSNDDDRAIPSSLPAIASKTSSMSIGSSLSPHEDFSCSKSLSSRSNLTISTSNTSIDNSETKVQFDDAGKKIIRKRRKEAKINETYDKSSQGSITDEIFSTGDVNTTTPSDTDTDDITFQNPKEDEEMQSDLNKKEPISLLDEMKTKMDTIVETSENSSPFKKVNANVVEKCVDNNNSEVKIEPPPMQFTMESLQELIEKQKQILETVTEPTTTTSLPFVKLSDLDKPPLQNKKEYSLMTNSAGFRVSLMDNQRSSHSYMPNENKTMSRSTGNNIVNLASSVENSKSLSRLFPHLSKVFSSSVPSNVGFNVNSNDQSFYEYIEFISSDFSCTSSSINSSRSGMESIDESSISCRQPRRLGEDLLKMFLQEIGTDITIDVNGKKIRAHKIILSSRCQYFAAMLAGKWVENNGNTLSLNGYSYSVVHFALQHVYSGAAHVPCGLDLMELASLSDFLGLEGLKEVTGYALKTNYCHNFHKPCTGCIDGVLEIMPVSLDHGFDDLYRKCLKWVCKHFCKVWTTKSFAKLNYDMQIRCSQQIIAHFTSENVLYWILDCEDVLKSLENSRWETFDLQNIVRIIMDDAQNYILDHFANLIASDCFLSLGHGRKDVILKLEHSILKAAASLSPDQACRSYPRAVRLNSLLNAKLIKFPSPLSNESFKPFDRIQLRDEDEEIQWNDDFIKLVSALLSAVEQCLIRQCSRAIKCSAWQRMDPDLRSKIQKIACVTESDEMRKTLRSSVTSLGSASVSSSAASRANDLRQVKLVIESNSNFSYDFKKYKASNLKHNNNPITHRDYIANPRNNVKSKIQISQQNRITNQNNKTTAAAIAVKPKVDDQKSQSVESKSKFNAIKPRYMEPRKPRITLSDVAPNQLRRSDTNKMSSSETSTRESSPAFSKKKTIDLLKKSSNLSLDSLQSPAKHKKSITNAGNLPKKDSEISMDSLMDSMKTSHKTDRASVESLVKKNYLSSKDNIRSSTRARQMSQPPIEKPVQRSFLSQKSREILSKKSQQVRKLSTNSTNSSIATKSTKSSSPKMIPINKSHSTTAVISNKKVFSTTLHLRKSAASKVIEPIDAKNITNNIKIQKKDVPLPLSKNIKENDKKKNEKIIKMTKLPVSKNNNQQKNIAKISPDTSDESFENKMARSNTFSKETSDNPIELLKTMN